MWKKNGNDLVHTQIFFFHVELVSPVQQSVVQMFTEALKDPVVVSDSRSFILAGRKVTLQLQWDTSHIVQQLCSQFFLLKQTITTCYDHVKNMCKFCFLVKKILTGPYDTAMSTIKEVNEHKGFFFSSRK